MAKRFRIAEKESIPTHFEAIVLRGVWRAAGLALGLILLAGGLVVVARADGRLAELAGPSASMIGLGSLVATLRLGRVETTIGTVRIECRVGPVRHLVPSGSVIGAACRPATGWRRFYADDEIVLRSDVVDRPTVIPAGDAAALLAAIERLA